MTVFRKGTQCRPSSQTLWEDSACSYHYALDLRKDELAFAASGLAFVAQAKDARKTARKSWIPKKSVLPFGRQRRRKECHQNACADALGADREIRGRFRARLVVQGRTDPHLALLRGEPPTASCRARNIFFGLAASAHTHGHKGDVTAAFLEGSDTELKRNVLAKPVQQLSEAPKLQPWECIRLRKAVYGQVNAPGAWWKEVNSVMYHLGWVASSLEPCL